MTLSMKVVGAAAAMSCLAATGASAAVLTFDFGLIGANGGAPCVSNCVLSTLGENTFTTGGVSVGAIGYNAADAVAYTTQKPGPFGGNGGETGLGESDTYPKPSDSDYEVTTSTWLLLDNSAPKAAGYVTATLAIESIQTGEGAKIYSYTGGLGTLDITKLTLLDTLSSPGTGGVTQSVSVPNETFLVIQAYTPKGGSSGSDIVVAEETFSKTAVPEPATWALMLVGLGGLGAVARRRRVATV